MQRGDNTAFYSYARSKTTIKESANRMLKPDGTLTTSILETTQTMNQTFQSVFIQEGDTPLPEFRQVWLGEKLVDINFGEENIKFVLDNLKVSSSSGPDSIHSMVLNKCSTNLALPVFMICRSSLDEGKLSLDWKLAHIGGRGVIRV